METFQVTLTIFEIAFIAVMFQVGVEAVDYKKESHGNEVMLSFSLFSGYSVDTFVEC